jgi:hypothetical protein
MTRAEKYVINLDANGQSTMRIRFGFGAAGEEVQKMLEIPGIERIRVRIDGTIPEIAFTPSPKPYRLLDIKQRIKQLTLDVKGTI